MPRPRGGVAVTITGRGRGGSVRGRGARGSGRGRGGGQGRRAASEVPSTSTATSSRQTSPRRTRPTQEKSDNENEEATETEMIALGMRVVGAMAEEDMTIFLDRLMTECPMNDKIMQNARCQSVKWEEVAFGHLGAEECQAAWLYLRTGTRKFRIMSELIQEVKYTLGSSNSADKANYQKKMLESAPGFPKKPAGMASGFQMFCFEMWALKPADSGEKNFIMFQTECQELYKTLPKEHQDAFQHKADLAKAEYVKQIKEFSLRHPALTSMTTATSTGSLRRISKPKTTKKVQYSKVPVPPQTPQVLFIQTKLNKLEVPPGYEELKELKAKYKRKWLKLKDKKKAKWIDKCINKSQNYIIEMDEYKSKFPAYIAKDFKMKKRISKSELEIWEHFKGKPVRPPTTAFDIYFQELSENPENSTLPREEAKEAARDKWTHLDYYHKEMYKVTLRKLNLEYKRDLENYFDTIPSLIQPMILDGMPKKYKNSLLSVDKCLDEGYDAECSNYDETVHDGGDEARMLKLACPEYPESEIPSGKKHKKKKRKHSENVEDTVEEDGDVTLIPDDDGAETSRKKKRKKKHRQEENTDEDYNEPETDRNGEDDEHLIAEESRKVRQMRFDSNPSVPKRLKKPKTEKLTPERTIKIRDTNNAIRGIFDARQHLGRFYSVFYYYAKYVARESIWIEKVNSLGILQTAEQIISTFLALSNHQKKVFIDQSYDFHTENLKEERYENDDFNGRLWDRQGCPGEPKPPPRSAKKLYLSEITKLQRQNKAAVYPTWEELDEDKQNLYFKKLYRITNIYINEYEDFVAKMTPSDLVSYTVECNKLWEIRYMSCRANKLAAKAFTFPLPRRELIGLEREPSPEVIEAEEWQNRVERRNKNEAEKMCPFGDDEVINVFTEKVKPTEGESDSEREAAESSDSGSDSPSDEELLSEDPRHRRKNKLIMARNEIKRTAMVEYPIRFL